MTIEVAHVIQGRLRLRVADVKDDAESGERLRDCLAAIQGIREIAIKPAIGSVLVLYDVEEQDAVFESLGRILPGLQSDELRDRLAPSPNGQPGTSTFAATVAGLLDKVESQKSQQQSFDLKTVIPLLLLALGVLSLIRQFLRDRKFPIPSWYEYFWFAFATFVALNPLFSGKESVDENAEREESEGTDGAESQPQEFTEAGFSQHAG